ncbi:hypothetical protein QR98_0053300 [Sarcoptes scabiei]|uniref:Uncharacterized protein n=1 Tax=Sarcoptes scabiei TaxID=52283 RepID=A0A132A8V4_SARSC|nr:hypothetical protein QR98_0053300 [Sarcoptes scabiei]
MIIRKPARFGKRFDLVENENNDGDARSTLTTMLTMMMMIKRNRFEPHPCLKIWMRRKKDYQKESIPSFDRTLALPIAKASRIARNTYRSYLTPTTNMIDTNLQNNNDNDNLKGAFDNDDRRGNLGLQNIDDDDDDDDDGNGDDQDDRVDFNRLESYGGKMINS